jgi:hypothetical protein
MSIVVPPLKLARPSQLYKKYKLRKLQYNTKCDLYLCFEQTLYKIQLEQGVVGLVKRIKDLLTHHPY